MSVYTLEHIYKECIDERIRAETARGRPTRSIAYYESAWNTLNAWLVSRLRKKQGAEIGAFGNFTWEMKQDGDDIRYRPIFLVSDSFVKDHHIKQNKFHPPGDVAPSEEVNYSKLAIKFSKNMTKDMLFGAIRDIFKKIGEYVDRFCEFEIAFAFGKFKCKERRIKFEFDFSNLAQILPESMLGEMSRRQLGYETNTINDNFSSTMDNTMGLSVRSATSAPSFNTTLPSIHPNENAPYSTRPSTNASERRAETASATMQDTGTPTHLKLSFGKSQPMNFEAASPRFKEILESMEEKPFASSAKLERRLQACDNVAKQAYRRCLNSVEKNALDDAYVEYWRRKLHEQWENKERMKREKAREDLHGLQNTLNTQLSEINMRREFEKSDRSNAACILPPKDSQYEKSLREKQELLKELESQIKSKKEALQKRRQQKVSEEQEHLNQVALELDIETLAKRSQHLEKQRDLLEAWEREAHVHNLRKMQLKGLDAVRGYMQDSHLLEASLTPQTASTRSMSIGFDSRRRK